MLIPLGTLSSSSGGILPFPSGITGLVARYDAQDLASISLSGSQVTQWNDLSGNAYHATQGTSTNRPLSGTRTINGKNVIDFDGSNDFLSNSNVTTSYDGEDKAFTIFWVQDRDVDTGSIYGFGRTSSNLSLNWFYDDYLFVRDNGGSNTTLTIAGSDTLSNSFITTRSSGLNFTGYVNKTLVNTGTAYNLGNITFDMSTIGALRYGANTQDFYNGAIGELIYYNRELTTGEVLQVHNYLSARWAI